MAATRIAVDIAVAPYAKLLAEVTANSYLEEPTSDVDLYFVDKGKLNSAFNSARLHSE